MVTINNSSIRAWFSDFLAFMGGCFGCCTNPTPIIAVDEPSKGLRIQGQLVKKPSISDDFWSTSTCDLDNSAVQSQRSVSSFSTSNQADSVSSQSDFVNHGLLLWNQTRLEWVQKDRPRIRTPRGWKLRLSWNATYDSLLTNKRPFPHPIPLSEMVEFLVDVWEHEGLYD